MDQGANIQPKRVPNQKDPMKNIGEDGRGICCAELDFWEANKASMRLALHPMDNDDSHLERAHSDMNVVVV